MNQPAFALGLMEQYSAKYGPIWLYEGLTSGYSAVYFYIPQYQTIISYTISIGSIKQPHTIEQTSKNFKYPISKQ